MIKDVIAPITAESKMGDWFVRNIDRIDLDHPEATAVGKRLRALPVESGGAHT